MKFHPLAVVFSAVATASLSFLLFIFLVRLSSSGDAHIPSQPNVITTSIRKLKESSFEEKRHRHEDVGVEDYGRIDPSPSSKALKPGPIEHGTPLNPFLPGLPPPSPSPSSPQFDE